MMRLSGPVLIADGEPDLQGDAFFVGGIVFPEVVRVSLDFSDRLKDMVGLAKLSIDGSKVMAQIEVFGQGEWLKSIVSAGLVFGAPSGKVHSRDGARVLKFMVDRIGLVLAHADPRMEGLKEVS
jgi:hypothetical protein